MNRIIEIVQLEHFPLIRQEQFLNLFLLDLLEVLVNYVEQRGILRSQLRDSLPSKHFFYNAQCYQINSSENSKGKKWKFIFHIAFLKKNILKSNSPNSMELLLRILNHNYLNHFLAGNIN